MEARKIDWDMVKRVLEKGDEQDIERLKEEFVQRTEDVYRYHFARNKTLPQLLFGIEAARIRVGFDKYGGKVDAFKTSILGVFAERHVLSISNALEEIKAGDFVYIRPDKNANPPMVYRAIKKHGDEWEMARYYQPDAGYITFKVERDRFICSTRSEQQQDINFDTFNFFIFNKEND